MTVEEVLEAAEPTILRRGPEVFQYRAALEYGSLFYDEDDILQDLRIEVAEETDQFRTGADVVKWLNTYIDALLEL